MGLELDTWCYAEDGSDLESCDLALESCDLAPEGEKCEIMSSSSAPWCCRGREATDVWGLRGPTTLDGAHLQSPCGGMVSGHYCIVALLVSSPAHVSLDVG